MQRETIIKAIEDFSEASGLKPSTICQYAAQNRRFYQRLKDGRGGDIAVAEKIMSWIDEKTQEGAQ